MTADVVTLGETMALLTAPQVGLLRHARSLTLGVAGAESNLAVGVTRLGGHAAWIGRVGNDEFGRLVQMTLRGEGVQCHAVIDPSAPTGLMFKERRSAHRTRVQYYRTGSAGSRLSIEDLDENLIREAKILHVTGVTLAISQTARATVRSAVEIAKDAGTLVSFDINHRTALWSNTRAAAEAQQLVDHADLVFATEEEARLVANEPDPAALASAIAKRGPSHVLVKRGADGVVAMINGQLHTRAAIPVTEVDPVGAGDAFAAAYLTLLALGRPVEDRLYGAAAAGAFAVTVPGDWEGLPSMADLTLLDSSSGTVHR